MAKLNPMELSIKEQQLKNLIDTIRVLDILKDELKIEIADAKKEID